MKQVRTNRGGFTLIEILLSIGILGIGMIMVITLLPVGADWTKRAVDDSAAQAVALNAVSVLRWHYPLNSSQATTLISTATVGSPLMPFPDLNNQIPINPASSTPSERCYQWGGTPPYPAVPNTANYFWTALVRAKSTRKFDVYILVFKKGEAAQQFTPPSKLTPPTYPGYTQIVTFNDTIPGTDYSLPILLKGSKNNGTNYDTTVNKVIGAIPEVGTYGLGVNSGTVFRQSIKYNQANPSSTRATQVPTMISEPIIFSPPSDGMSNSPLVYVFQTTLTY